MGCLCNAATADVFVTSLGEIILRKGSVEDLGSINLVELAQRKGFDWEAVCRLDRRSRSRVAKRWKSAIDQEWKRRYRLSLSAPQRRFVDRVLGLQQKYTNGRFRVYGQLHRGRATIVLVTEFLQFCDQAEFWRTLKSMAKKLLANFWVMHTSEHLDKVTHNWGTPQARVVTGPNHGRLERQVELAWRLDGLTQKQAHEQYLKARRGTQSLWRLSGVNVI